MVGSSTGMAWYINWPERNKLKLVGGHGAEVTSMAFSADSAHLASASRDGSVVVWKLPAREQLVVFRDPRQPCTSVAFAPLSTARLTRGAGRGHLRKKKKKRSEGEVVDGSGALRGGHGEGVGVVCDGLGVDVAEVPHLVAGYGDGTLRVFDAMEAKVLKKMQPHSRQVRAVAYSQNGKEPLRSS